MDCVFDGGNCKLGFDHHTVPRMWWHFEAHTFVENTRYRACFRNIHIRREPGRHGGVVAFNPIRSTIIWDLHTSDRVAVDPCRDHNTVVSPGAANQTALRKQTKSERTTFEPSPAHITSTADQLLRKYAMNMYSSNILPNNNVLRIKIRK